jgi:murein DD-endopeptidase MepM/ murein hydrolase activator NlpD
MAFLLASCAGAGARFHGESATTVLRGLLPPVEGRIVSGYGGRGDRLHKGVDILAPEGTPVHAAQGGFVFYAGDAWKGYGNAVAIDHGERITSLYGHLREIHVKSGDAVPAGAAIGTVGMTGNATTPHLHFEVRVGDAAVDPVEYIEGMGTTR